jgi:hypothetical protein
MAPSEEARPTTFYTYVERLGDSLSPYLSCSWCGVACPITEHTAAGIKTAKAWMEWHCAKTHSGAAGGE